MNVYQPKRIYIERAVQDSPIVRNVLTRLPGVPVEWIDSTEVLLENHRRYHYRLSVAKRYLVLARHQGRFLRLCPGGSGRLGIRNVCCHYLVLTYATNCYMDCSYCYLQWYLNLPYLIVYANHQDLLQELEDHFAAHPGELFRVGTGELADSLALDPLTAYSVPLVEFFARQRNALLELKTKSDLVDHLLGLDHRGRTVPAWSLNPRRLQESEEHKTASIDARLQAARRCVAAGYPVAFHFDPLICYPEWEAEYGELVDEIFECIPTAAMAWVSMGALRLTLPLQATIRERFPSSPLTLGEFVPGEDGKMRYFKPIRVEMYRHILARIRRHSLHTPVYTCMEKPEVWTRVFGTEPPSEQRMQVMICAGLPGRRRQERPTSA